MQKPDPNKTLAEIADSLGVSHTQTHLFLCTGPTCSPKAEGLKAWNRLKKKIKTMFPVLPESAMYRTKVECLRICAKGPIAVAYPQGKWFHSVTEDNVEEIVEHLHQNKPHRLEFKTHKLP